MRIPLTLSGRTFFLLFGAIFLSAGTSLLYGGITTAMQERAYQNDGEIVEAVVSSKSIQRASLERNTSMRYEIIYSFTTADGTTEGVAAVTAEEWEALEPGSRFKITHLPGTPRSSRSASSSSRTDALVMIGAGSLAALFGGIVFARSASRIWRERRLLREGLTAQGTVLAIEPSALAVNRIRQWHMRYRYQDHIGRVHEGRSQALPPDEAHAVAVGDTVTVRFDRDRPEQSAWDRARLPGARLPPWARLTTP